MTDASFWTAIGAMAGVLANEAKAPAIRPDSGGDAKVPV